MNDHARRLVDHGEVFVFVNDRQIDGLGLGFERLERRGVDLDRFAAAQLESAAPPHLAGDAHPAAANPALQPRAADLGQTGGRRAVQTRARIGFIGLEAHKTHYPCPSPAADGGARRQGDSLPLQNILPIWTLRRRYRPRSSGGDPASAALRRCGRTTPVLPRPALW